MIRYLYILVSFILAVLFWVKGDDIRSDIFTAAFFIMMYIEGTKLND